MKNISSVVIELLALQVSTLKLAFRASYFTTIVILVLICCGLSASAQSPDRIPYQAVIRNSSGAVLTDQSVGVRISILRVSSSGTAVYSETHAGKTNAYGQLTLEIGAGTVVSGGLSGIDWSQGPFHIRMETDPAGGTNYQIVGSTQLLSVPFSLFAKSASLRYSQTGDTLFSGTQYVIVPGLSASNSNAVLTGSPNVITSVISSVSTIGATLGGEVIGAGTSPVTARGICYGTNASPTTANSTVAGGSGTGTFSSSITGLNPATTYYARAYAVNASGTSYGNQVTFRTEGATGQACAQGSTMTVTHTAGDVAPVTKTVTYKLVQTDLSGSSKCWIAQNLGSDRQALSFNDFTEESAGWYWQFNRKQGYKLDGLSRIPSSVPWPVISENSNWDSSNDPCTLLLGSGWRLPSTTEWELLASALSNQTNNQVFNSVLRLHRAGILDDVTGSLLNRGLGLFINLKNQSSADQNWKGNESGVIFWNYLSKRNGAPVRCLKD